MAFADYLGPSIDNTYNFVHHGGTLNLLESWVTTYGYSLQLYFDFSGYCDMAVDLALLFNIRLPYNFNSPYKSLSISEFWQRWHMTLGQFLKQYLYIPLGGNRKSVIIAYFNLLLVFFISGIWHGAGWGFMIWGLLHGVAICIHKAYNQLFNKYNFFQKRLKSKIYIVFAWILTFNFLNFTWIFFKAENFKDAISIIKSMLLIDSKIIIGANNAFTET